jgi:hypothetical protein
VKDEAGGKKYTIGVEKAMQQPGRFSRASPDAGEAVTPLKGAQPLHYNFMIASTIDF